jgi:glycosyltransferase involved in cell wall biosynthesis
MSGLPSYVIVTPARNEAQFIEATIKSVVAQTVLPLKWLIVSDGSTDGTDDIVRKYTTKYSWIELVRMPERRERHFAGKVHAFDAGYETIGDLKYQVIVSLDGDISFGEDYFSYLLHKIGDDPALGLVGTPFKEGSNSTYDYRFVNIEHVSGACQVFHRSCFEEIGGYTPVKAGCIDHIAVVSARMKGWKTRTFTDHVCFHHRDMGTAQQNILIARFKNGRKDYSIGNHPIWEVSRVVYQMSRRPLILGGMMLACGYVWAMLRREQRPVSTEVMTFVRREQMARLKRFFVSKPFLKKQQSPGEATSGCS